jgi:hypothetical protein
MFEPAWGALSSLQNFDQRSLRIDQIVELYCYSLELQPFQHGLDVAIYLLKKRRTEIEVKKLPELLGPHAGKLMDLMQILITTTSDIPAPLVPPHLDGRKYLSLSETVQVLYDERNETGDFVIAIFGSSTSFRVHSFAMYSSWPYFKMMYDSGFKEKQEHRLVLPLSSSMLELIIELCYRPEALGSVKQHLDAQSAIEIVAHADLYFDRLVTVAEQIAISGLNVHVCIQVFQKATAYGLADTAAAARQMIVTNIRALIRNPQRKKEIKSLPANLQLELLWSSLESTV